MCKQFIDIAKFGSYNDGFPHPEIIRWKDGREYRIDEVLSIDFSLSNEYSGYRYKVKIGGIEKFIYNKDNSWYVMIPDHKMKRNHRT